jgi:serine/threonine kinase PknH
LMTELRDLLEDDRRDPTAIRDITQLLRMLRDRADVTWRVRTEVDATLTSIESPTLSAAATVPFTGPQTALPDTFSGPQPTPSPGDPHSLPTSALAVPQPVMQPAFPRATVTAATVSGPIASGDAGPRKFRRRWAFAAIAGVVVAVAAGITLKVVLTHPAPNPLDAMLLSDAEINTIMGDTEMKTVENGNQAMKQSSMISVSAQDCMGSLYPGLDSTYKDSGELGLAWKTAQKPGGLPRAGESKHHFVDQDVAVFPVNSDQPFTLVARAANQWKGCKGRVVSATYADHRKYTWTFGALTGEAPRIIQTYSMDGDPGYACQRVLSTVSNYVVDAKACGYNITDQANRIVDEITADVRDPNGTK